MRFRYCSETIHRSFVFGRLSDVAHRLFKGLSCVVQRFPNIFHICLKRFANDISDLCQKHIRYYSESFK